MEKLDWLYFHSIIHIIIASGTSLFLFGIKPTIVVLATAIFMYANGVVDTEEKYKVKEKKL